MSARAKRAERRSLSTKGDGDVTPPGRRGEGGEEDGGAATAIKGAPPASYEDGKRIWDEEKGGWCSSTWGEGGGRRVETVGRRRLQERVGGGEREVGEAGPVEKAAAPREGGEAGQDAGGGEKEGGRGRNGLLGRAGKKIYHDNGGRGEGERKSWESQGNSTPRAARAPGGVAEQLVVGRAGKGPACGAESPASHGMPAGRFQGRGPAARENSGEDEGPVHEATQLGSTPGWRGGERGAAGDLRSRLEDYSGHRMAKPIFTPGKYDGTGHLTEYLAHFDLCRRANGWDMEQAGVFLGLSLMGVARRLLEAVEPAMEGGYLALRRALEDRFQPKNQGAMYKAILRAKERLPGECLQAHAEDIERYTRLAYPKADLMTIDVMAKDRFIESLRDTQLQYWIFQSKPETIRQAVQVALEAEACMRPQGHPAKARVAGATMAEQLAELASVVKAGSGGRSQVPEGLGSGGDQPGLRPSRWRGSSGPEMLPLRRGGPLPEGVPEAAGRTGG